MPALLTHLHTSVLSISKTRGLQKSPKWAETENLS